MKEKTLINSSILIMYLLFGNEYTKVQFKLILAFFNIIIFSVIYYMLRKDFNKELTVVDALYFSSTIFTAIGIGDVLPVTNITKLLTCIQTYLYFYIAIF